MSIGVAALVLAASASGAREISAAQGGAASRTVWDGVYTEAQAEQGKTAYEQHCSFCHLSDLTGQGFAPALIEDAFTLRWQDGNVGELYTVVKVTMPQDKPDSLSEAEYTAIVAFLLKSNKYPAGQQELTSDPAALKATSFKRPAGQ
jgi:cytochrome c5